MKIARRVAWTVALLWHATLDDYDLAVIASVINCAAFGPIFVEIWS